MLVYEALSSLCVMIARYLLLLIFTLLAYGFPSYCDQSTV